MIVPFEIPVDPSGPEAQRLLEDELAKSVYTSAQPSAFDRAVQAVLDWVSSLFSGDATDWGQLLGILAVTVLVAAIVTSLLIYGVPRLRRRAVRVAGVFGDVSERTAAQLRAAAEAAAREHEWTLAVEERFRALARDLDDRGIVHLHPGTTAHAFAREAGKHFAEMNELWRRVADIFDAVRYSDRAGTQADYEAVRALDQLTARAPMVDAL